MSSPGKDPDVSPLDWSGLFADRIGGKNFGCGNAVYKFERIKRAKESARKEHPDVSLIDMGIGEGDWSADPCVVETLCREAGLAENRRYADNGIPEFRAAAAQYMDRVFDVPDLDPESEILPGIGSKSLLAQLPACFINPGDILLATVPSYPVAGSWTRYLGGDVHALPLLAENRFLPDLERIPAKVLRRAKMLYINYPNNPTGAVANPEFFSRVVDFARKQRIMVVHDAAYAALTYGGNKPLSFLSVPGARDVGVEVHSLSKSFNMTGWRMSFVCGNSAAIAACAAVKDNTDAGQFRAVQKAAVTALGHPEITEKTAEKYSRRFDLLVPALRSVGFEAEKPAGSFYCYVRAPSAAAGVEQFQTAEKAAEFILSHALVSTVPWDEAGAWLRFSVTFEAGTPDEEIRIVDDMKARLAALGLVFGKHAQEEEA